MIGLATQHSRRAALVLEEAFFTIRLRFSGKFSAVAASAGEFSRHSSVAATDQKIGGADPICATTCRSSSKRLRLAPKKRSRSRNSPPATNATAAELNPAHARSLALPVVAVGR